MSLIVKVKRINAHPKYSLSFYSHNTNLLPPKPKSSFRHLKQGIQEFYRKYVLVPVDKPANNIVVVCRLRYINIFKQELNGTKAYKETSTDESNRKAINRNWSNQKANLALKTKTGNK